MFRGQILSPFMHVVFQEPQENNTPLVRAYLVRAYVDIWLFAYRVKHSVDKPFTLIEEHKFHWKRSSLKYNLI